MYLVTVPVRGCAAVSTMDQSPSKQFHHSSQTAVLDVLKAKVDATTPVLAPCSEVSQIISLTEPCARARRRQSRKREPVRKNGPGKRARAA